MADDPKATQPQRGAGDSKSIPTEGDSKGPTRLGEKFAPRPTPEPETPPQVGPEVFSPAQRDQIEPPRVGAEIFAPEQLDGIVPKPILAPGQEGEKPAEAPSEDAPKSKKAK